MNDEQSEEIIEYRKVVNGRVAARFRVATQASADIEQLLRQKGTERLHHGNCRAVVIWGDYDEAAYAERIQNHHAKPIDEKYFPSAMDASLHFGLNPNAVSQELKRAKRRGQDVAQAAGIPVRWADEVGGD